MGSWIYLFTIPFAVLPRSDAGSDGVETASGFVIQNCQISCSMWCSMYGAPYSQFGEEARSYLCMDEWNCPTPVRRQLDLTQAIRSKLNLTGLALVIGMKAQSLDVLSQYSVFGL